MFGKNRRRALAKTPTEVELKLEAIVEAVKYIPIHEADVPPFIKELVLKDMSKADTNERISWVCDLVLNGLGAAAADKTMEQLIDDAEEVSREPEVEIVPADDTSVVDIKG